MKNNPTVFGKILRKEVETEIVYEDELCIAFPDKAPQAPVHILIIPKVHIEKISDAQPYQEPLLGRLLMAANKIAEQKKLTGYRLVINNGKKAGQTVFHLHVHLLGGRALSWPPG